MSKNDTTTNKPDTTPAPETEPTKPVDGDEAETSER